MLAFCSTSSTVVPLRRISAITLINLLHNQRTQAERGLVEQQDLRAGHQAARNRDHLLLPSGEHPAKRVLEIAQLGKDFKHALGIGLKFGARAARAIGAAEDDVLADGQPRKHPPALGHVGDAKPEDRLGRVSRNCLAKQAHGAGPRFQQSGNDAQGRALAGAVGAEQGNDFTLVDVKRESVERRDFAVCGGYI